MADGEKIEKQMKFYEVLLWIHWFLSIKNPFHSSLIRIDHSFAFI